MATALLEKQAEQQDVGAGQVGTGPVPYHWTVDALRRALVAGVWEHPERLELIQGRIIENMSQNAPHASLRRRFSRRLRTRLEPAYVVMEESSLRLALDTELVPDALVVVGSEADYDQKHPAQSDAVLVVEVSDTTAAYDLGGKALLYAQAGIMEYWVVLVNELILVRHREPSISGYGEVVRLTGTDTVSPLIAPEAVWTIGSLLGLEE